jgi:hypothetical protein
MNGKASKRLRLAAAVMVPKPGLQRKHTYDRLKKEYLALPLHRRTQHPHMSHSSVLRQHHEFNHHHK